MAAHLYIKFYQLRERRREVINLYLDKEMQSQYIDVFYQLSISPSGFIPSLWQNHLLS